MGVIRLLLVILALFASLPVAAQSNPDIDAAARSVVRVVVVAPDEVGEDGLGMGSGVAITPTRILTNAHVVEAAVERGGFVGIVPSEGRKRFQGKVIAYAPDLDLALIALQDGTITPAVLNGSVIPDGTAVAALGYPFGVDRAMASGVDEVVRPQSPVKSLGSISGRRSNARFDTLLHTAAIGRGNSGGPLVDACGRVIGINSFLSITEGIDSTFAFALSVKEVAAFLSKAKVAPTIVTTPCLTQGDAAAREAALAQTDEESAALARRRAERASAAATAEKMKIRDTIASERENGLAAAALLLAVAVLTLCGGGVLLATRPKRRASASALLGIGALLVLGAVLLFLTRPKMSDAEDRYAALHPPKAVGSVTPATEGPKLCVLNPDRSRVTVSQTDDVPLDWREGGCVNGKTQYGQNGATWSRTFVPNSEATVTIQNYDPARRRYTVERYLLPADAMEAARRIRSGYRNNACSADIAQRQSVAEMESAIRAALPQTPNERLVFDCHDATGTKPAG